ncbi:MAG TPA: hypothetical protein VLZ81_07345 [Blastocatellia bacterium]|nr:hypothetical protein [Blastocatellia bacterium]
MDALVKALGPAFAAGLAIQQLLELLDPFFQSLGTKKKIVLNILALVVGLALAFGLNLEVIKPLIDQGGSTAAFNQPVWDHIVTGLIISGGTQGINSILKFMGYAKEQKKNTAASSTDDANKKAAILAGKTV